MTGNSSHSGEKQRKSYRTPSNTLTVRRRLLSMRLISKVLRFRRQTLAGRFELAHAVRDPFRAGVVIGTAHFRNAIEHTQTLVSVSNDKDHHQD
jgi:hypothetical protein